MSILDNVSWTTVLMYLGASAGGIAIGYYISKK